jgi:hypothetical protein
MKDLNAFERATRAERRHLPESVAGSFQAQARKAKRRESASQVFSRLILFNPKKRRRRFLNRS